MLSLSTRVELFRILLGIHLMMVAISIVLVATYWPRGYEQPYQARAAVLVAISLSLLVYIALSSAWLASGKALKVEHACANLLWLMLFLYFYYSRSWPLSPRLWEGYWPQNDLHQLNGPVDHQSDNATRGVFLLILQIILFSLVPAFANRYFARFSLRPATTLRAVSIACIAVTIGLLSFARLSVHLVSDSLMFISCIGSLCCGFLASSIAAANGDPMAGRLLVGHALAFGLLQVA